MTSGLSNYFSRQAFALENGKVDVSTRAFMSKFKGRTGPAIPSLPATPTALQAANTINAIIKEFEAQGWIQRGYDADIAGLGALISAITMIPSSTMWEYAPYEVFRDDNIFYLEVVDTQNGFGAYDPSLWQTTYGTAAKADRIGNPLCDWALSVNALQQQCPTASLVNLYVAWFGNDLNAVSCSLYPAVTDQALSSGNELNEIPHAWSCNGVGRYSTSVVSQISGSAAYGGTPDDQSVIDAIRDLKARKLQVCFTPFILMDVPTGNALTDPYTGASGQPVYPWRGRITKQFTTADETPQIATEAAAFVTQYRAFVLHYANLCASAGGVDVFMLGTEMRGMTWLRDAYGSHPFVAALVALAADVKAILPAAKTSYAADWTEFTPFQSGSDVTFHLDPLWSDSNIDAIGIDCYWPRSDWRDSGPNIDGATYPDIYDYAYQMASIQGGEGYDWYYASDVDRTNQVRTAISDGAYGKPWVFKYKDIWNWWSNAHYNRPGGVESGTPTSWVAQSKPIWFTEMGVPSVDKGTNQPNVFYDPKSSESAFPYFSNGSPDYTILLRGLHAFLRFFNPNDPEFLEANNPQSSVYSGRMVDISKIMIYTWDARPYPAFPIYDTVWSDSSNWIYGHWINGKFGNTGTVNPLDAMASVQTQAPLHPYIVDPATGQLDAQYRQFFEAIGYIQQPSITSLTLSPTLTEVATAVNSLLATMRSQKRIAT